MTDASIQKLKDQLSRARRRVWASALATSIRPTHMAFRIRVQVCAWREDLAERGGQRLRLLLHHAATRVPYYRRALGFAEAGALPELDEAPDLSLGRFPVMTKQVRRDLPFDELIARDPDEGPIYFIDSDDFYISRTSGSTGVATSHLKTMRDDGFWAAVAEARIHADWAIPFAGEIYSTGLFRARCKGSTGLHSSARETIDHHIMPALHVRWNFVDLFQGGSQRIEDVPSERVQLYEAMLQLSGHPAIIAGAPSRMLGLARYCSARGHVKRPKAILTTYEPLRDADRKLLADTFACPVVSMYSLTDVGTVAWECSARRLHFDEDLSVVEILDDKNNPLPAGRVGRVVLTSLGARVMPIIRFDTGDMAARAETPCPCGKTSPSVHAIEGRQVVKFVGTSGRLFESHLVLRMFDEGNFREFQIIQDRPGELRVVVPQGTEVSPDRVRRVEQSLLELLAEPFQVEVDVSGGYVLTASGKRNPAIVRMTPLY